jgi:hypothetical protein
MKHLTCKQANDSISILDFLKWSGFSPNRISGINHYFISPFRPEEKTASMKVNAEINRWIDYGTGNGGKLIDLAIRLWRCDVKTALIRLSELSDAIPPRIFSFHQRGVTKKEAAVIENCTELQSSDLLKYVEDRAIPLDIAKKYCHEIHYIYGGRRYRSIAFPTDLGGFETRNAYFKGCVSKKSLRTIVGTNNSLLVFEGFMDMLSALVVWPSLEDSNIIVMNSLSQFNQTVDKIRELRPDNISVYLDNDNAGIKSTQLILSLFNNVYDASVMYKPCKDVNDFLLKKYKGNRNV